MHRNVVVDLVMPIAQEPPRVMESAALRVVEPVAGEPAEPLAALGGIEQGPRRAHELPPAPRR